MLEQKNGRITLYTRGNGTIGRDISHLIPLMKKYGKLPNINDNYCVRGELIVNKTNFKHYSDKFTNSRSMVNGIIGSKEIKDNSVIKVLDFVIFEMMYYNEKNKMTTETQLKLTQSLGFKTCLHEKYKYDYLTFWR